MTRRLFLGGTGAFFLVGCRPQTERTSERTETPRVTVYTSLDEPYARPVLEAFTRETGVPVQPVYDTEANKSRGLAQKILAEKGRPRADVFWSSEILQMLRLKEQGALAAYQSPSAEGIPSRYRDPEGYWTGFAARFRVLACNREKVSQLPRGLADLTDPRWKGEVAMAQPLFGTTTSEAAALYQLWGPEKAAAYYRARKQNETRIVSGNSAAAERAAQGEVLIGQTDTDDAYIRIDDGASLEVVFPDQDGVGAMLIPNTAALVQGGPQPDLGRKFLDYLLQPETELLLAGLPSRQLPLHPTVQDRLPEQVRPLAGVKAMELDYPRLLDHFEALDAMLRSLFLS